MVALSVRRVLSRRVEARLASLERPARVLFMDVGDLYSKTLTGEVARWARSVGAAGASEDAGA